MSISKKEQILQLVKEYYQETFADTKSFEPGDRVNYAGRLFDEREMVNLIDSSLEFWLTSGRSVFAIPVLRLIYLLSLR
jgi:CDP-6-deoxy-D-xylo-4-hexulose-3-dehydrase